MDYRHGLDFKRAWFWPSLVASAACACLLSQARQASDVWAVCSKARNIYTVDDQRPRVNCVAVRGTMILGAGDYDDLMTIEPFCPYAYLPRGFLAWIPEFVQERTRPRIYQLADNSILVPGLADAHAHIIENGYMARLPLKDAASSKDATALVAAYIRSQPADADVASWVEGMGWDHTRWPGAQFPTAADMDAQPILKGRLISLTRVDGHARWVSPAVLELIGDLPETVDGGVIVRDEHGTATGIFVDNAMDLIPVPPWSEALMADFFNRTITESLQYGLTSIHDADTSPARIAFFRKLADAGRLPIRLYLMGYMESNEYWGRGIPRLLDYGVQSRLNLRSVKLFADGALGSWSASLLSPYTDLPDTAGLLRYTSDVLKRLIQQFQADGWQTSVHCIGDCANQIVLDIYEDIIKNGGSNISAEWRPRIEHAVMLTPRDLERIGSLGVIASVQPTQATTDMTYAETRMGPERLATSYAYQSLLNSSANHVLPLGSDFPVESVNPLFGFYAAVTRLSVDGSSPHGAAGWFPDQRLTRVQALKGMTYDAAYAAFAEDVIGSLVPGKKADFVILDRDIMTVPESEILGAKVTATVIDGEVVYGSIS